MACWMLYVTGARSNLLLTYIAVFFHHSSCCLTFPISFLCIVSYQFLTEKSSLFSLLITLLVHSMSHANIIFLKKSCYFNDRKSSQKIYYIPVKLVISGTDKNIRHIVKCLALQALQALLASVKAFVNSKESCVELTTFSEGTYKDKRPQLPFCLTHTLLKTANFLK